MMTLSLHNFTERKRKHGTLSYHFSTMNFKRAHIFRRFVEKYRLDIDIVTTEFESVLEQ